MNDRDLDVLFVDDHPAVVRLLDAVLLARTDVVDAYRTGPEFCRQINWEALCLSSRHPKLPAADMALVRWAWALVGLAAEGGCPERFDRELRAATASVTRADARSTEWASEDLDHYLVQAIAGGETQAASLLAPVAKIAAMTAKVTSPSANRAERWHATAQMLTAAVAAHGEAVQALAGPGVNPDVAEMTERLTATVVEVIGRMASTVPAQAVSR